MSLLSAFASLALPAGLPPLPVASPRLRGLPTARRGPPAAELCLPAGRPLGSGFTRPLPGTRPPLATLPAGSLPVAAVRRLLAAALSSLAALRSGGLPLGRVAVLSGLATGLSSPTRLALALSLLPWRLWRLLATGLPLLAARSSLTAGLALGWLLAAL